jgi:hypothetical protein
MLSKKTTIFGKKFFLIFFSFSPHWKRTCRICSRSRVYPPFYLLVKWTGLNRIRTPDLSSTTLANDQQNNVLDLNAFYWRSIRTELERSKSQLFITNGGVTHLTGVVLTTWPFSQPIRTTPVPDASEFKQISQSECLYFDRSRANLAPAGNALAQADIIIERWYYPKHSILTIG